MSELSDILDLSIVQADLGLEGDFPRQNRGFWGCFRFNPDMALVLRRLPKESSAQQPICIDYTEFVNRVAERNEIELDVLGKPRKMDRPIEVDDQVVECTPQFILRNIPKIEHYYDLERPPAFDVADMPRMEAEDQIREMHNTHIGKVEFIPVESTEFVSDFRSFLEEIFVLCPWDRITRQDPPEDNPWHIQYSTSKLAQDLLSRKNTLYIFSEKGMTKMAMKEYKRKEEKSDAQGSVPSGVPGGFHSYGPG